MRRFIWSIAALAMISSKILANGVCIIDAEEGLYLQLVSSSVEVIVENQVSIVTATQTFINRTGSSQNYKYAFPLSEEESAIGLRWFVNSQWNEAIIEPSPQDTTLPGGGGGSENQDLIQYLGNTPIYFNIDEAIEDDSTVVFELSYVNLLPYEFGNVYFSYPNSYSLIQDTYLDFQHIEFTLNSARSIEYLSLTSHEADSSFNSGHVAYLEYSEYESAALQNYEIQYGLSLNELGLFGLSTLLPDTLVADQGYPGFFIFVAEPDPGNSADVIDKVFTLIIDRSGSMEGSKMVQARNAASFIVNNLNEGDKFNIVDFSSEVESFQPYHVNFNSENQQAALNYISALSAYGATNISGAFAEAIPQFSAANDSTANIIIFFTDGQATAGITDTEGILESVSELITTTETEIMIFSFGIGDYVEEQLLTLLAVENNGLAEFLGNDEVESRITSFYLMIRNPVLLNTEMTFSPQVIFEAYPLPLPNLYQGQQMIVAGRYNEAAPVDITLMGHAFGQPVSYTYDLPLADSANVEYQFLPKIWAKKKIENLLIQYYSLDENSAEADELVDQIISLSLAFGVITPFTSFTGNPTGIDESSDSAPNLPGVFEIIGNYPNPFNPSTTITLKIDSAFMGIVTVKIYNPLGQLVKILYKSISAAGVYEIFWDGKFDNGQNAPSGTYLYLVNMGDTILGGKMTLLK